MNIILDRKHLNVIVGAPPCLSRREHENSRTRGILSVSVVLSLYRSRSECYEKDSSCARVLAWDPVRRIVSLLLRFLVSCFCRILCVPTTFHAPETGGRWLKGCKKGEKRGTGTAKTRSSVREAKKVQTFAVVCRKIYDLHSSSICMWDYNNERCYLFVHSYLPFIGAYENQVAAEIMMLTQPVCSAWGIQFGHRHLALPAFSLGLGGFGKAYISLSLQVHW